MCGKEEEEEGEEEEEEEEGEGGKRVMDYECKEISSTSFF